jgi:hypothetical protein
MKYRIISEDELLSLLWDSHKLACLDWDGVDNWEWYMEGRTEYIAQCLKESKQYKDKSIKEIMDIIYEEDIDFQTLAEIDVEKYAEYEIEGKPVKYVYDKGEIKNELD